MGNSATGIDCKTGSMIEGRTIGPSVSNRAVAGTPSVTVAAPAATDGARLIVNSIFASIACAATAQTPIGVRLRDGAAGPILWEGTLSAPVGGCASISANCQDTPMTVGNAAVLQFEGPCAAGVDATVALGTYQAIYSL